MHTMCMQSSFDFLGLLVGLNCIAERAIQVRLTGLTSSVLNVHERIVADTLLGTHQVVCKLRTVAGHLHMIICST